MDNDIINDKIKDITDSVSYIDTILENVVSKYTSDLDILMENINKDIIMDDCPAINIIEKYFMELTSAIYYMSEKVEKVGIYDSISKSKAMETYNMKYLEHQHSNDDDPKGKKPTVAESTAVSENGSFYDKTINDMYNKAYRVIKTKVDASNMMVNTLSKVLSRRMQEVSMLSSTGKQILNENN